MHVCTVGTHGLCRLHLAQSLQKHESGSSAAIVSATATYRPPHPPGLTSCLSLSEDVHAERVCAPASQPTTQSTIQPTKQPIDRPANRPTSQSTIHPADPPTNHPTNRPAPQPFK
eukprot:38698-Chlamydomonas_euryale.AAC.4